MTFTTSQSYRKWYIIGLIIFLTTAIFSTGYHNHDEHFQILEFCNYKMGLSPASDLPWEFNAQIRPALQPFIAYCFAKTLDGLCLYNPFGLALLLRCLMAVLNWWVIYNLVRFLLPEFKYERGKWLFVCCSFLLWFVPYLSVRFSAEGLSGLLFCAACYLLLKANEQQKYSRLLIAGSLLGFGWSARPQLAFALIGVAIWILVVQRWKVKYWLTILLSFAAAIAVCTCIDYWFYGQWVFTPYRYFETNILQSKAAEFGVSPWWGYFELFVMNGVPPISIVLLILFLRGAWDNPKHLFTLACTMFFVGHFLIGHKEMRFLFPLAIPFIFVVCKGIDSLLTLPGKKIYNIGFKLLIVINMGLLMFRAFTPAQDNISYYKYMYRKSNNNLKGYTHLYCIGESPYNVITLNVNFYKSSKLQTHTIDRVQQLDTLKTTSLSYVYSPRILDEQTTKMYKLERVYASLPDWALKYNFNNWQERTKLKVIYRISKS